MSKNYYKFVENAESDFYGIKVTSGSYKDVVVVYGRVSIKEEDNQARLSFTYNIQDPASFDHKILQESEEFNTFLGDMLTDIIQETLNEKEAKIGSKSAN